MGIEPTLPVWKTGIITIIRRPQNCKKIIVCFSAKVKSLFQISIFKSNKKHVIIIR